LIKEWDLRQSKIQKKPALMFELSIFLPRWMVAVGVAKQLK
jgi:hypothetical protein